MVDFLRADCSFIRREKIHDERPHAIENADSKSCKAELNPELSLGKFKINIQEETMCSYPHRDHEKAVQHDNFHHHNETLAGIYHNRCVTGALGRSPGEVCFMLLTIPDRGNSHLSSYLSSSQAIPWSNSITPHRPTCSISCLERRSSLSSVQTTLRLRYAKNSNVQSIEIS